MPKDYMAPSALTNTATSPTTESLEGRFQRLRARLRDDVKDLSCQVTITEHPAFREILSLGEAVVPLMLRDLDDGPRPWIWALTTLTGVDPVPPTETGKVAHMGLAWLRWARKNGYPTKGIEDYHPILRGRDYQVTGPPDADYNCFALAIGVTDAWWTPKGEKTLATAQSAFVSLGYAVCDDADLESGYEKVALFHNPARYRIHAARQLKSGRWTSKLGMLERIEHALRDLEGAEYGSVAVVMKRPVRQPSHLLSGLTSQYWLREGDRSLPAWGGTVG